MVIKKFMLNKLIKTVSSIFLSSLPTSLTQLKALVELTLNDLSLSSLPDDIGK
jgi:hypothetical protein